MDSIYSVILVGGMDRQGAVSYTHLDVYKRQDKLYKYMENLNKTDIGLIGLAVMGENLALNMADKGWRVSVYNRTEMCIRYRVRD